MPDVIDNVMMNKTEAVQYSRDIARAQLNGTSSRNHLLLKGPLSTDARFSLIGGHNIKNQVDVSVGPHANPLSSKKKSTPGVLSKKQSTELPMEDRDEDLAQLGLVIDKKTIEAVNKKITDRIPEWNRFKNWQYKFLPPEKSDWAGGLDDDWNTGYLSNIKSDSRLIMLAHQYYPQLFHNPNHAPITQEVIGRLFPALRTFAPVPDLNSVPFTRKEVIIARGVGLGIIFVNLYLAAKLFLMSFGFLDFFFVHQNKLRSSNNKKRCHKKKKDEK